MIFLLLLSQFPGFSQFHTPEIDSISKQIPFINEQKLAVEVDIGSFKVKVGVVREPSLLMDAKIKYDSISVMPVVKYQIKKGVGEFSIQEEKRGKGSFGKKFGFKNTCELMFTPKIPLYLDLSVGAGDIDLSGLKVAKLNLKTRQLMGKSVLCFGSPNPVRCKDMHIFAQMGNFSGKYLGNGNFDVFYFQGGIGLYTLDFRFFGELSGDRRVEIAMGGGSLKLILPKEVGVRLKPSGISFRGAGRESGFLEVGEGWYESQNWGTAESKLVIHIDSSIGILRVEIL